MTALVVTPHATLRTSIADRLSRQADVDVCAAFVPARVRIRANPYALLVTSLRLGAYNGLHLAYLARTLGWPTRAVVFDPHGDGYLAALVQEAGAFYEDAARIALAAPSYLHALLPERDRRDPMRFDRRRQPRGGRRAADLVASGPLFTELV